MKKHLLKIAFMGVLAFYAIPGNAQSWTFDSDLEGFGFSWNVGQTVEWDSDGGNGTLKLTRAHNFSNFAKGSGGNTDPSVVGIDADATKYLKIKIKNLTSATGITVGSKNEDGVSGSFDFNNVITANTDSYSIVYLDMTSHSFWEKDLIYIWIAVKGNYVETPGSDTDAAYISSLELLSALPANEESEFLKNPNFDDASGITHITGGQGEITREVTADIAYNGEQSLKFTAITAQTQPNWMFTNFYKSYSPDIPANSEITMKAWVRSSRNAPASIFARLRLNHSTSGVNVDNTQTTSGTPDVWEELTFTFVTPAGVSANELGLWLVFNWETGDPNGTNLVDGDVVYFDNMSATIGEVLSNEKNTLEGVSLHPNPVNNELTINTLQGGDISIYNVLGTRVKTTSTSLKTFNINVSDLTSGIYIVKIDYEGKLFTQKLVKK